MALITNPHQRAKGGSTERSKITKESKARTNPKSLLLPAEEVAAWAEAQADRTPPWNAATVERILWQLGLRSGEPARLAG